MLSTNSTLDARVTEPTVPTPAASPRTLLTAAAPALFVLLWSTGFIGAKLGLPYAEPFTFLALRYALVSGTLLLVLLVVGPHGLDLRRICFTPLSPGYCSTASIWAACFHPSTSAWRRACLL